MIKPGKSIFFCKKVSVLMLCCHCFFIFQVYAQDGKIYQCLSNGGYRFCETRDIDSWKDVNVGNLNSAPCIQDETYGFFLNEGQVEGIWVANGCKLRIFNPNYNSLTYQEEMKKREEAEKTRIAEEKKKAEQLAKEREEMLEQNRVDQLVDCIEEMTFYYQYDRGFDYDRAFARSERVCTKGVTLLCLERLTSFYSYQQGLDDESAFMRAENTCANR
jgi:hypothetical protein